MGRQTRETRQTRQARGCEAARAGRFTLVLGGGGSTGMAYMCGALRGLEEVAGLRPHDADLIIGTSAGSVLAADLRLGRSLAEIMQGVHPRHAERAEIVRAWRSIPDLARRVVGSTWVASRSAIPMPSLQPPRVVQRLFPASLLEVGGELTWEARYPTEWPAAPLWITAADLDGKRRVVLDAHGRGPRADLRQAVRASCAVPGVYAPVRVGNRRLIDGGMTSVANLDLAARSPSPVVVALAPMAFDPRHPPSRVHAMARARFNVQLRREGDRVRRAGKRVLLLRPTGAELEHHGFNFLSDRSNDVIERAAYEATVANLSADRVRLLLRHAAA